MDQLKCLDSNQLIKNPQSQFPGTVVLIGNGALENGWLPLRKVLDEWINRDVHTCGSVKKLRAQNSEALQQLSILSYKFKLARGLIYKHWNEGKVNGLDLESQGLGEAVDEFIEIRKDVGVAYSQESLNLAILEDEKIRETLTGKNAVYITTNWDNALWKHQNEETVIYLHGRCDHPDSLVFPTELIVEDINYDCSLLQKKTEGCSRDFYRKVMQTYRCETVHALLRAHELASHYIQKAQRLVIWGYSLGDFDADINALIGTSLNRANMKELVVINTNPYAFQRAIALTGLKTATHYNPRLGSTFKFQA